MSMPNSGTSPVNVSAATAALIQQAQTDQADGAISDTNESQALADLATATAKEKATSSAQLTAHKTASASAYAALNALAADFNVPISDSAPPAPAAGAAST